MKRKVCLLLSIMLLFSMFNTYAATDLWDGYTADGDASSSRFGILDFNSINSISSVRINNSSTAGNPVSMQYTADSGKYSIHWDNHPSYKDLYIDVKDDVPTDWSSYNAVEMKIYSQKATNAKILFMAQCPDGATGIRYYYSIFNVDWTGWKTVRLSFSDMTASRSPSWTEINRVRLCAGGGWDIVADEETDIYIGTMDVVKTDPYDFIAQFYDSEITENVYANLNGAAAVYAGGSNAVTADGAENTGYTFGWVDSTVTVPARFFADYFGASVTGNGGSYSITLGENIVSGIAGETKLKINGIETDVHPAPYSDGTDVYVPGAYAAELLGLKTVIDNKLLVIGTSDSIEVFDRKENLGVNEKGEIAAYLSYHDSIAPEEFTSEDCKDVKKNWIRSIVGDETTNDITDADIKAEIDAVNSSARASWNKLIKTENSTEIFTGLASTASSHITSAYSNVYNMARGYACYGGELYGNEELLADIIYALDWLKTNRYNLDINKKSETAPWTVTGFDNWWDWSIGTPRYLIQSLIMIEDKITDAEIAKYLEFFDYHVPIPRMTGSNFTNMATEVIGSALLQNDSARVLEVQTMITKTFLYVDDNKRFAESMLSGDRKNYTEVKGAGFFTDGSYIFHTLHPHNATYGLEQFAAFVDFISLFGGTEFEMKIPFADNVIHMFEDTFDSVIYDTKLFRWTLGRTPSQNTYGKLSVYVDAFKIAPSLGEDAENIINDAIKEIGQTHYSELTDAMSIDCIKRFKQIMSDDSVAARDSSVSNKVFYNSDKVVHKTENWAAAVSMSSSRIFNYESINSQNMDGWYLSDGRTEYYLAGSNVNATQVYWDSIDKYRLPGTTVDTQERKKVSIHQGNEYLSTKDFVGGATLGDYGTAAMHLESYHNESDFGTDGGSYGALAPAHKNDLTAKKAYFMFDDELVCLGTEINAKDNNGAEVLTIVDNLLSTQTATVKEGGSGNPYPIASVSANQIPEPENIPENTIDDSYSTKYAGELNAEIVWDIGSVQTLGFIELSFMNGSVRNQYFKLAVSSDGSSWTEVFDGESSGKTDENEYFDLKSSQARFVKFTNLGNSVGNGWVSITNCRIYPPNADGTLGLSLPEVYGTDAIIADGRKIELLGDDYSLDGISWLNAAGTCGYVFPKGSTESPGSLKARWTNGKNSHFELWFSHGVNPENGGYAYILLPGKNAEETAAYAADSGITVLENNEKLQAAKDTALGVTGVIFWEAGSFGDITVSEPCIVVYRENDGELDISVSDPTRKLSSLKVTIGRTLAPYESDDCVTVESGSGQTIINCDVAGSDGRSMQTKFKSEGAAAS